MDTSFEAFCLADDAFYETPVRWVSPAGAFEATSRALPAGWERGHRDPWVVLHPPGVALPPQGWKIHVSACTGNAAKVLDAVWDYCTDRGLSFKFLHSVDVLRAQNLKYAPRASSGKMVTIYPCGTPQLRSALDELSAVLEGDPGPYVLSDLRWGAGPLYTRYGGFVTRFCQDDDGATVPAIERPDGSLVPDVRKPVFEVPPWVEVPDFFAPHLAARAGAARHDLPYRVERALHFSNGGGVYLAERTSDGRAVVLKESRPFAGLDGEDRDAVARMEQERWALERLAGVEGVPALLDAFTAWEHRFLAIQHVDGRPLQQWVAETYPFALADPSAEAVREYTAQALALASRVEQLLGRIHERSVVYGDLHPNNVLVDDDGAVTLVDFELAAGMDARHRRGMGYPGFAAPGTVGLAADEHALAALRLWLFLPLTPVLELDPGKAEGYARWVARRFDPSEGYLSSLRPLTRRRSAGPTAGLGPDDTFLVTEQGEPDWDAVTGSVVDAIHASATPERTDRLFPGDIRQFLDDGLHVAHGAAGVLWALHACGVATRMEHETWLLDRTDAAVLHRTGFFDGMHGLAHVLDALGHRGPALALLERAAARGLPHNDVTLYSGLSGIALNALHFASVPGGAGYADLAEEAAGPVARAIRDGAAPGVGRGSRRTDGDTRGGLLHGWSGPALCMVRLHEATGDEEYLDLAVRALHLDLDTCVPARDGSLQVDGGFRLRPYLAVGSAGVALVADEVLTHRADVRTWASIPLLARACRSEFVVEPQLFSGRAGLLATLARLHRHRPDPVTGRAVDLHLRQLAWHALHHRGHIAFPGAQLRRLSMDLATGGAGVLVALAAAVHGRTGFLPFLEAAPVTAAATTTSVDAAGRRSASTTRGRR